ncbi:MAG TPA: Fic family protein [Dehalococcoidia bacterium]|nr:Fic family protein [Dehalococcoidia bacterium]
MSSSTVSLLDRASRAVGMLAGVGETLPNPHLLIRPFLRREAVLSSKIEGTQTSISDLFLYEASGEKRDRVGDAREVRNYVKALEHGLQRLDTLPLSVRLFNELHAILMEGVRGEHRRPGELRTDQVRVGSDGTSIGEARFIPPPANLVPDLLADFERFLSEPSEMPPLIQCALMHYQFETIHPYFDGNGRVGRLLIVLFLCAKGVLPTPLLYLSAYLERHRGRYYDRLLELSAAGNWEPWLQFFLLGIEEQSLDAIARSRRVRALWERYRRELQDRKASANTLRLLDELFQNPFMTPALAAKLLSVTWPGAKGVLERLRSAQVVRLVAGRGPIMYVAQELLEVIEAPTATPALNA